MIPWTVALFLLANEKEIAMGRAINAELRKQSAPVDDARLNAFATAIAAQFQKYCELQLSVEVTSNLEKRDISALPGGFLRIPLGAVLQAETETQLAFAIAHAVAHLSKRHHVRQPQFAASPVPLTVFHSFLHGDRDLMPTPATQSHRDAEAEADTLAAQWTTDYQSTGEFEEIRSAARAAFSRPRKEPSLRRSQRGQSPPQ